MLYSLFIYDEDDNLTEFHTEHLTTAMRVMQLNEIMGNDVNMVVSPIPNR